MKIETRYNIGDKVWVAYRDISGEEFVCSQCKGKGDLTVKHEDTNTVLEIRCPICRGCRRLWQQRDEVRTRELTIGAVRFDSFAPNPLSYMCEETGVGNGSVYYEPDLFDSEADALAAYKEKHGGN